MKKRLTKEDFKDILIDVDSFDTMSPFAKYLLLSRNYDFFLDGILLHKYEAFGLEYTNLDLILDGHTPIVPKLKK